jgi:hypothetical protein
LTANELCLFFYFAVILKQDLSRIVEFRDILSAILQRIDSVTSNSLMTLLWGLGIYKYSQFTVVIKDTQLMTLAQATLTNAEHFPLDQCSSLAFACSQIFSGERENPLLQPIIKKLALRSVESLHSLSNSDIINFLLTFVAARFADAECIHPFVVRL